MSLTRLWHCDRCRGPITADRTELRVEAGPLRRQGTRQFDFCPACLESLTNWLRADEPAPEPAEDRRP